MPSAKLLGLEINAKLFKIFLLGNLVLKRWFKELKYEIKKDNIFSVYPLNKSYCITTAL